MQTTINNDYRRLKLPKLDSIETIVNVRLKLLCRNLISLKIDNDKM